jgi:hypothetical protein
MKTSLTPYGWLFAFLSSIALLTFALTQIGCTQAQTQAGLADAQTAANVLETINADTGGAVTLFTQAAVDKALVSTHNSGDVGVVNAAIVEGAAALKVQTAAAAAGASSTTGQTLTTAVLVDPAVINTGAAAAAGPTGTPVETTPPVPASAAILKVQTEIRAEYGSMSKESIYDLRRAGDKPRTMVAKDDGDFYIF